MADDPAALRILHDAAVDHATKLDAENSQLKQVLQEREATIGKLQTQLADAEQKVLDEQRKRKDLAVENANALRLAAEAEQEAEDLQRLKD